MTRTRVASALEVRYGRLLRAYPSEWRDRHGGVVLGVLLDAAEAEGRSAPTVRETADLLWRGLLARSAAEGNVEVRGRVASIGAGLGVAFALAYFGVFIRPDQWGHFLPVAHLEPALILVSWVAVAGALLLRWRPSRRAGVLLVAILLPLLLFVARGWVDTGGSVIVGGWARPSNANAAFLACLAVLASLGRVDRRLLLRTAVLAAVGFGLAFWITGAWQDPYDQALWGSPSRTSAGAAGTLQTLWSTGNGHMPGAGAQLPTFGVAFQQWSEATVLRLNTLPVLAIAAVPLTAVSLVLHRRRTAAITLLVVSIPFLTALIVCAAQPLGVWFQ